MSTTTSLKRSLYKAIFQKKTPQKKWKNQPKVPDETSYQKIGKVKIMSN